MLFFKDTDAWLSYAAQNGIEIPGQTPPATEGESATSENVTEIPTIEIPTQGPGLEFIPPENNQQNDAGCHAIISISAILLISFSAVSLIKNKTKKGDPS